MNLLDIFVLFVTLLSVRATGREKRQVDQNEKPRIVTANGHLLFQTGDNHNITFKTGTTGSIVVGEDDLTEVIKRVRRNKADLEELQRQVNSALQRLDSSDINVEHNTEKIGDLETRITEAINNVPDWTDTINQLQTRLDEIEQNLSIDECASNPCSNGGRCTNLYNGFQCQCPPEWTGSTCSQDVNECTEGVGSTEECQNGGRCQNEQGSFRCDCTPDWFGPQCTIQYDDCTTASHRDLCGHGYCINEPRAISETPKYSCICFDGWTSDSSSSNPACTIDVNECDSNPCFEGVNCNNVAGTFYCGNCPTGYTGNGLRCSDVNECLTDNGGCSVSPLVTCTNTVGSRTCGACPLGYVGDGATCTYIGVCTRDNGGCSSRASCAESTVDPSGRTCTCDDGYSGNGVGPHGCELSTTSCSVNPCFSGRCLPDGASYLCICNPGYTGRNCDTNINECSSNPCDNGGTCVDGVDGFTCTCASGYAGDRCQETSFSCGGDYTGELGTLTFPGEGQTYPHGVSCTWTITTSINKVLVIQFTMMKIEVHESCNFDSVQLLDGPSLSSYPLSRPLCGNDPPHLITSTHNQITIRFVSDASVTGEGFSLTWSSILPVCGGIKVGSNHGNISSPGYPGNYPINRDCTWSVFVEAGRYITFSFAAIDLEASQDCSNDFLEVFDGLNERAAMLGRYCTNTSPLPVSTTVPYAFVRFHSNSANTAGGFLITYTSALVDPGCGGALTDTSGIIISPNYPNEYDHNVNCIWTIELPENARIRFEITDMQLEGHGSCAYDYVEVRDGPDESSPFVGLYCHSGFIPPPIISSSNTLYVKFHTDGSIAFGGFRATYDLDCGGTFTEDNGELLSPLYPNAYPHRMECEYFVTAGPGQGVEVTFQVIAIEYHRQCGYDFVEARDGDSSDAELIGRYCGVIFPDPFTTTQSSLYMKFQTDGSISNYGFRATYQFVEVEQPPEDGCGGTYSTQPGTIHSPVHPENYPHNTDCTYVIQAGAGEVVRITFVQFQLEGGYGCPYDWVMVYDGTQTDGTQYGRYCSSGAPPMITTTGNLMTVVFHSDYSVAYDGFLANYVFVDSATVCGGYLTAATGVITSPGYPSDYFDNAACVWTIVVPSGQQIAINITNLELESSSGCTADFLELRNGGYISSPLIDRFCGTLLPSQRYVSHSNRMYIRFVTDFSVTRSGFSLSYDAAATGCGGILSTPTGSFISPNYPQPYDHGSQCFWNITINPGNRISLSFSAFHLEYHSRCIYDYIKIFDGPDESSPLIGKYCGSTIPPPVNSSTNHLFIKYRTDGSVAGTGFSAEYTAVCQEVTLTERTGYIESLNYPDLYQHSQQCSWVMQAAIGIPVNITFIDVDLEPHPSCLYDYINVIDGSLGTDDLITQICDTRHDGAFFVSTGNALRIEFSTDFSVASAGFRAYYAQRVCGETLTGLTGNFSSPNYPTPYDHSIVCQWQITVELGYSITLTLEDIDMEQSPTCQYDSLRVYSGSSTEGFQLASICTREDAQTRQVSSSGNEMFVRFQTDASVNGGGFRASYTTNAGDCTNTTATKTMSEPRVKTCNSSDCSNATSSSKNMSRVAKTETGVPEECTPGCGGNFSTDEGSFHSLNYPSSFPHNSDCSWLITLAENSRVELTFDGFNLETSENCTNDYLRIYDGDSPSSVVLLNACGDQTPGTVISSTNKMFIHLHSDPGTASAGFAASYSTGCGGRLDASIDGDISSPGYPSRYSGDHNCTWILEAPNGYTDHITLTFTHMDLEVSDDGCYDYVQILDGNDQDAPERSRVCGVRLPSPITSFGSSLVVNFITDFSNHGTGFRLVYSTTGAACGGDFRVPRGSFASPGYPDSYPQSTECIWTLANGAGSRLHLLFMAFDIEESANCTSDFLEIRENGANGTQLDQLCSVTVPRLFMYSTSLWLRFWSDGSGTAGGFVATFDQVYGGDLTGSSGEIVSPNYPLQYPNLLDVSWTITTDSDYVIRLAVTDFNVEGSDILGLCSYDYLRIYDGINDQASILATLCDTTVPGPIYTTGNTALLKFVTDATVTRTGFRLLWQQLPATAIPAVTIIPPSSGCNRTLVASDSLQQFTSPGYPISYDNSLRCFFLIYTPSQSTILLNFTDFSLEFSSRCIYDYVKVYDGSTTTDTLLGNFCGQSTPGILFSTGQTVLVEFVTDESLGYPGFSATYKVHCGGMFTAESGIITSPGYPGNYPANSNCTYLVQGAIGSTLEVAFTALDIQQSSSCTNDYLMLRNGGEATSPPLGSSPYCGSAAVTGTLVTSANLLRVEFTSDGSGAGNGFSLTYRSVTQGCGGSRVLTESLPQGIMTSPNYPDNYNHNTECEWVITSPAGTLIRVTFNPSFYIEEGDGCEYDYVQIRNGALSTSDILGQYCGNTAPTPVTSTSNALYVRFRTDYSLAHRGFNLTYAVAQCGGTVSGMSGSVQSSGYPNNYLNDQVCEWYLEAPSGHFLTISFQAFALEPSVNCTRDYLVIHDGRNQSDPLLRRLCGNISVSSIETSSNVAYLKFVSDASGVSGGFSMDFTASEEVCGEELQSPTGTLQSPNYPQPYAHGRICEWRITVQEGFSVTLIVGDIDIEDHSQCRYDYLIVYNGLEDDAPIISTLCGTTAPDRILSSGNTMRVVFRTDGSINGRGFQATYESHDQSVCGGNLQTTPPSSGMIMSPGYDLEEYANNLACDWTLTNTLSTNSSLQLRFDENWGLEASDDCIHDYLEIRRGIDQTGPLIGKYCGDSAPQPFSSPWSTLFIRFRTDGSVKDHGFKITYHGTDCGGIVTGASGAITSPNFPEDYPGDKHCSWLIQAPAGSVFELTFSNFSVQPSENCASDNLIIKNGGNWDSPSMSGEYGWCDTRPPPDTRILSSSNEVIIIFSTDRYRSASGFRLEWTTEMSGCGGLLQGNSGSFQSDNYPQPYEANQECIWVLVVEGGYNLQLTFDNYNLGAGDSVTIYNGQYTRDPVIGMYNQTGPQSSIRSNFEHLTIKFTTDSTNQGTGFTASWTNACGGTYTSLTGRISSPGFPYRKYDDDRRCEYVIQVNTGDSVLITFDDRFDMEADSGCAYDYLSFYDGVADTGTLLGTYCGSTVPDPIENFGSVFVVFRSDGSINGAGFAFDYEPGCGGLYTEESGTFGTPAHLQNYGPNHNCTWRIEVSENKNVQLRFESFAVETHTNCIYDYLIVYDGTDTSRPLTGRLCGMALPDQLISTGNTMMLNFVSDRWLSYGGFRVAYQAVYGPSVGCGGHVVGSEGTIRSVDLDHDGEYDSNLDCYWYVSANDSTKVLQLNFTGTFGMGLSSTGCRDYVEIRDGFGSSAPLVGQFCGNTNPAPVLLSGNQAFVRFFSDSSNTDVGFTLSYTSVNRTCGGLLNATEDIQVLTSPNYPQNYSHNTRCTWVITAPNDEDKVRLITTALDIEDNPSCSFDYVQFSDFPHTSISRFVHYCGQALPPSFDTTRQAAHVHFVTDLNTVGRGFSINYLIADCNQNLTSSYGHLNSPGYPISHHNNHDCTTRLTTPNGTFLTFYFDHFDLEPQSSCLFDSLRIRNGTSTNSSAVLFTCGSFIPDPVFIGGNEAMLEFHSDRSVIHVGYSISYTSSSVSSGCGGSLSGSTGSFTSPGFPGVYPANLTCDWSIEVPARRQPITLVFTVLNVEGDEGLCQQDYIAVYQGTATSDPLIGRYCGTSIPATITATINTRNLFVRFVTNAANTGETAFTGFRAVYSS